MYAVGGRLVDSIGSRLGLMIFVSAWSVVNMLHGLARSALHFSIFRFMLGIAEPANFPGGVKAVSEWFPLKERALAVGIFNAGTSLGSAFAALLVPWIALTWGWRWAFVATGAVGFIWVAVWAALYRLPQDHPWITAEEKNLILSDAGEAPASETPGRVPVRRLLRMPETWGCVLARVLTDPISYFLFFWTPQYFQRERGFNLADVGVYLWIPFVALTLGNLASGGIPRWLIARGWPLSRARKGTMLAVSLSMPVLCLMIIRASPAPRSPSRS